MLMIHQLRGTGKTEMLINLSKRKQIPIVVSTKNQAKILLNRAKAKNISIPDPIVVRTWEDFNTITGKYLIDNIDMLISSLSGGRCLATTSSIDNEGDKIMNLI